MNDDRVSEYLDRRDVRLARSIRRTCCECGRKFWISRDEPYAIQVCCDQCSQQQELTHRA
jgi:hypothetical protein